MHLLGEGMTKNQCTRLRTVKNVQQWISSMEMGCRYSLQQFLEWFGVDRKLERIIWATLKKSEIIRKSDAEEAHTENKRFVKAKEEGVPFHPNPDLIREPDPPRMVVGFCPRCSSNVTGFPVGGCSRDEPGTFGKVEFYKECGACSYYAQIWKKRNKYKEVEGG